MSESGAPPSGVPAAWYADPNDATRMRYWNGTQWTDHYSARPVAMTPALAGSRARNRLWTVGILVVLAVGTVAAISSSAFKGGPALTGTALASDVARVEQSNGVTIVDALCPDVPTIAKDVIVSCTATVNFTHTGLRVTFDDDQGHFTVTPETPVQ